jgi:predicted component of viral defense system (DUF524 family)
MHTLDTAENRFVKAFLQMAHSVTQRTRELSKSLKKGAFAVQITQDCERMERKLRPALKHSVWQEVGPMVHLPAGSTVLQQRRGYKEVFRHFSKLRLAARVSLPKTLVQNLLEAKDVALLYEIWCYFAVCQGLESILGSASSAHSPVVKPLEVAVSWEFEVRWRDGTQVSYNSSFYRSGKGLGSSYSVGLRPDISILVPDGPNAGLHLLDAKFKLQKLDSVMQENEDPEVEREERQGTFKRADLYKMHTYRDAIPEARSVWVIYPGTETRFFAVSGSTAKSVEELPLELDGVGAIPLTPSTNGNAELDSFLRQLLGLELPC